MLLSIRPLSKIRLGLLFLLLLSTPVFGKSVLPGPGDFEPGAVLVRFRTGISPAETQSAALALGLSNTQTASLRQALGAKLNIRQRQSLSQPLELERWTLPAGLSVPEAVLQLSQSTLVGYAQPNYKRRALAPLANGPNDPDYQNGSQWWLEAVQADRVVAENKVPAGQEVVVAIVDSGILLAHEDLAARLVPGVNFVTPGNSPNDDLGHGTHVAGIVGAITNNHVGIASMCSTAPVKLMPVKVLDSAGEGFDSDIAQGMIWAVDHGARVLNLSFGSFAGGQVLEDAVNYVQTKGCLSVASAGNFALESYQNVVNPLVYPAAFPQVVSVAASTSLDARADYSEYNEFVDLAAPGGSGENDASMILSTFNQTTSDYAFEYGTSMAAPMVAGEAAMLWVQDYSRTPEEVLQLMVATADKIDSLASNRSGWDKYLGWGRINLYQALTQSATFKPKATGRASYNYPNPFGPALGQKTYILIPVAQTGQDARLRIFDSLGHLVKDETIPAEKVFSGSVISWDGRNQDNRWVANGVYPYRLEVGGNTYTNKIAVLNK